MTTVDARGEICPIPLIKAKEAIKNLNGAGDVEVLVDNEIAVQNLEKMAGQMEYGVESSKEEEKSALASFTRASVSRLPHVS